MATKQLSKEFNELAEVESDAFEVSQSNGNVLHWEVMLFGPEDSPYADGMFFADVVFPDTYPEHPPKKVEMKTKIYHPNIDFKGRICLGDIKEKWNNKMNAKTIIDHLVSLMKDPDASEAINSEVAKVMTEKPEAYKKTAKEWTEKYAQ
eukprot:CAMPEP_0114515774 /NCGR_PEP_ID=MMETSP0109-20121206/16945_1 /TAXON_ID=29199 /ORGANISM="Chlorarachnion reptans, Strain CCCM449" /LENGTH=148 /DNA_ID=CAMNT_0001696061 /DNA_START=26 /DNA_END=475 /DNA_ORIENTATION=+